MKKFIRKIKRLFIEELEVRRSTSPLLIQTMSVGEAGTSAKNDNGGKTSGDALAKQQTRAEKEIEQKYVTDSDVIMKYGLKLPPTEKTGESGKPPEVTTTAVGEEGTSPTYKIGESGKPPISIVAPEDVARKLYAPPLPPTNKEGESGTVVTTLSAGEEGTPPVKKYAPPIPIIAIPPEKPPIPIVAKPPENPPVSTTMVVGEEGKPVTTAVVGEEGKPSNGGTTVSITSTSTKTPVSKKPVITLKISEAGKPPTNKIGESGRGPLFIAAPTAKPKLTDKKGESGRLII